MFAVTQGLRGNHILLTSIDRFPVIKFNILLSKNPVIQCLFYDTLFDRLNHFFHGPERGLCT